MEAVSWCVVSAHAQVVHVLDPFLLRQAGEQTRYLAHIVPLQRKLLTELEPHLLHGAAAQRWHGQKGPLEDGNAQVIWLVKEHRRTNHADPARP